MTGLELGVVILNWNGLPDTLACLDSIYSQQEVPRLLVLVDNGSSDGSVEGVRRWIAESSLFRACLSCTERGDGRTRWEFELAGRETDAASRGAASFILVASDSNLGFSAGNNVGLRLLLQRDLALVMLLNNDTIVEQGALGILTAAMDVRQDTQVVVPQIRYWGKQDRIWSCGGEWTWMGTIRSRFADQDVGLLGGLEPFPLTFVTGCALAIRSNWLEKHGLLSERFFFGEEDIELSWRLRESGGQMLCWPGAVVFHKVGVSITKMADESVLPKLYGHYLNRTISLKTIWGRGLRWHLRRAVVLGNLGWKLHRRFRFTASETLATLRDFVRDSDRLDGISRDYFFWLMKEKFQERRGTGPR